MYAYKIRGWDGVRRYHLGNENLSVLDGCWILHSSCFHGPSLSSDMV